MHFGYAMTMVTGLIGMVFDGRYQIVELIGKGGMGAVYKAIHLAMNQTVALKVLSQEALGDDTAVQRFYHEAKASSRLKHPNTIKVFDFGRSEEGHLYLAMEYLSGETLGALLRDEKVLPVGRTIKIVKQVLKSLGEAHEQGLVHRDLKPDNIFLTEVFGEADFVKVLDFGISKFVESSPDHESLTQAGLIPGTPLYVSPEQALGRPIDGRADLYALGVILYQMVTGRPPFKADSAVALVMKQIHDLPPDPNKFNPNLVIPDRLRKLIFSLLEKDPNNRPAKALDVYRELEAIEKEGGFPEVPSKDVVDTESIEDIDSQIIPDSTEITSQAQADHDAPTTFISGQEESPAEMKTQFINEPEDDDDALSHQPTAFIAVDDEEDDEDATLIDSNLPLQLAQQRRRKSRMAIGIATGVVLILAIGLYLGLSGSSSHKKSPAATAPVHKVHKPKTVLSKKNVRKNTAKKAAKKKKVAVQKPKPVVKKAPPVPVAVPKFAIKSADNKTGTIIKPVARATKPVVKQQVINVVTQPPKAIVRVNGRIVGVAPVKYKPPKKEKMLTIQVSMKDYKTQMRIVKLGQPGAAAQQDIVFHLQPTPKVVHKTPPQKTKVVHKTKVKTKQHKEAKAKKHVKTRIKSKVRPRKKTVRRRKRHHKEKLDWDEE